MTPGLCTCAGDIAVSQSAATETRKHTFFFFVSRHSVRSQMEGVFVTQSRCMSGYFFMYTTKTAIIALGGEKRRQPLVSHGAGKKESG